MAEKFCVNGHKLRVDNVSGKCAKCKRGDPAVGRTASEVRTEREKAIREVHAHARALEKPVDQVVELQQVIDSAVDDSARRRRTEHAEKLRKFRTLADALGLDPDELLAGWIDTWMRPLRAAVERLKPTVKLEPPPARPPLLDRLPPSESMHGACDGFPGSDFAEGGVADEHEQAELRAYRANADLVIGAR